MSILTLALIVVTAAANLAGGGTTGRIGGIAVDPTDPAASTANGGVWKTTNGG